MYGQIKLVDGVLDFSPPREKWRYKLIEDLPEKVTVRLKTGQTGVLDMKNIRAVHWAYILDRVEKSNEPIYLEIDEETNVVTNLLIPMVDNVRTLRTNERGDIVVGFIHSPAVRILLRTAPNFETIQNALNVALENGADLLITETRDEHEIIDARPPVEPPGEPPGSVPEPPPDDPVTEERAVELFDDMNNESCNPCDPTSGCIPFKFPDNGCQHRAHKMCKLMMDDGEEPEKVWLRGNLVVPTVNHPYCQVEWSWHVAPTLEVIDETEKWVIDPSLGSLAESLTDWRNRQGDLYASIEHTDWTQWDEDGDTDPELISTNHYLGIYAEQLRDRCDQLGPPPYSCTRNCFFIIDRNTFSDAEIEAMLHVDSPAVIEAAFYIIVDGFSPEDLGFTSASMEITPELNILPEVPEIHFTPVRLEFEYDTHLNRRQRLTWVYDITFDGTSDFTSDQVIVTLEASISSVSGNGYFYLIRQPNPYETDGATSWLSTDLRVFQINQGDEKFGETMGTDPCQFIANVITRLNNNNTNGQTFEGNISVDQQTSRMELSQMVDGVPVYNFAVAKVRYRSLVVDATDVRVFFRLFPWATTSLEYDQDTTYRRYESGGKVIPLLGMVGNDVNVIPCFATPRIDSVVASMTTQPDDLPNKITLPPNPSGEEVVRYFGCWLDINQTTDRFPFQTTNWDGPFPTGSESILDHIRSEHQCLVSEIFFSPAVAQDGTNPSISDKLAQRNLAIFETTNPGTGLSRRIPQTFQIQPSKSKLENDELMIDWGNIPVGSVATLYLPGVDTDEILLLTAKKYRSHRLVRIDEHTLKSDTGGITYLPIPLTDKGIPGLLTVDLPEGITKGQTFKVVVRQVTGVQQQIPLSHRTETHRPSLRHIVGSFQLTIPVRDKADVLPRQQRLLSNLRWIERAIPANDRWAPVFGKYVAQIGDRVDALGGDSSKVAPSASGQWREAYQRCLLFALVAILLIAAIVVCTGVLPGGLAAIIDVVLILLLVGSVTNWRKKCRPRVCQLLRALLAGAGIGAIILAILALAGVSTAQLIPTLLVSAVATVLIAIWSWGKGCFRN